MHKSHENIRGHKADFRVRYKFRSPEEGGRKSGAPGQGYRSDFSFEGGDVNQVWMIHPEFEDEEGELILNNEIHVPNEGTARMWVLVNEMRPKHYDRIIVGAKGYFREGAHLIADCEIIEVLDLKINPTENK